MTAVRGTAPLVVALVVLFVGVRARTWGERTTRDVGGDSLLWHAMKSGAGTTKSPWDAWFPDQQLGQSRTTTSRAKTIWDLFANDHNNLNMRPDQTMTTRPQQYLPHTTSPRGFGPPQTMTPNNLPRDCNDLWSLGYRTPGVFTIYPGGYSVKVWCEHSLTSTTTVVQRRQYGNVSFVQPWSAYKSGFGDLHADFWIGLDALYMLTYYGNYKLSIALQNWSGATQYMVYTRFLVGSEATGYRLTVGYPSGALVDDLSYSNGMPFATYDRPDTSGCATNQHVGWWYNYCAYTLLNGKYYYGGKYNPPGGFYDGIYWKDWLGYDYSLKFVSMALVLG